MNRAIYGGSFNPWHCGHQEIAYKASTIFDELYVVVARNADKPNSHTSLASIRSDLKAHTVCDVRVVELPPDTLLVDFARDLDVKFLVRGVRGAKDFASELEMADINLALADEDTWELQTVFLPADPPNRHISSSLIRSLVGMAGWVDRAKSMMPKHSAEEFIARNSQ